MLAQPFLGLGRHAGDESSAVQHDLRAGKSIDGYAGQGLPRRVVDGHLGPGELRRDEFVVA
ncbi:hypothetical protein [Streptomyces sp. SLBN-8D4]|uniref:hypothetical protein n=1 Tax=Streptomyces sp. SLBN-8D4 TaxID=3377728 RepID=UPI003C7D09C9